MAYKSGVCHCCTKKRPVEGHHVWPLELGGPDDGPKVNICGDCHSLIHKEADMYFKHGKFQDLDHTIPFEQPDGTGKRIRELIAKIVKAKQLFAAGEGDTGEQRRMTQISWDSDQELLIAHDVKRMMKFKSLERAIKHLVFEKFQQLNRG